jgi:hypothetical protein
MDNLDEIEADAIIISASDFPITEDTPAIHPMYSAPCIQACLPMLLLRDGYFSLKRRSKRFTWV